jgi:hypothetical protein
LGDKILKLKYSQGLQNNAQLDHGKTMSVPTYRSLKTALQNTVAAQVQRVRSVHIPVSPTPQEKGSSHWRADAWVGLGNILNVEESNVVTSLTETKPGTTSSQFVISSIC